MSAKTFEKLFLLGAFVLIVFSFWLGGYVAQTVFHASNINVWGAAICTAIIPTVFCACFHALIQSAIESEAAAEEQGENHAE